MNIRSWAAGVLLLLAVGGIPAGASSTGGAIGNLIPAPKFLKGSIVKSVYSSRDKFFSVASPHQEGSDEYRYMKVKEQYSKDDDYLSFGPAALDQSIYRIEIAKRLDPRTISMRQAAPMMIAHYRKILETTYKGEFRPLENSDRMINGRKALYFRFGQTAPPGRLMTGKSVEIDHQIYIIDFGSGVAMVWVQSNDVGAKSDLSPEAFASSLTVPSAKDLKVDRDGFFRFKKQPIDVKIPPEFTGDCSLVDTDKSVDILPSDGIWTEKGQYAVMVFPGVSGRDTGKTFLKASPGVMKQFIVGDRAQAGFAFQVVAEEPTTVNGHPAYRAVGIDRKNRIPAVYIGTSMLLKSRIVIGSLVLPLDAATAAPGNFESWKAYNQWVSTIAERP